MSKSIVWPLQGGNLVLREMNKNGQLPAIIGLLTKTMTPAQAYNTIVTSPASQRPLSSAIDTGANMALHKFLKKNTGSIKILGVRFTL